MSAAQSFHDKERERLEKAKAAIADGLGIEGAAVAAYGRSNDETVRRARDLLREEG